MTIPPRKNTKPHQLYPPSRVRSISPERLDDPRCYKEYYCYRESTSHGPESFATSQQRRSRFSLRKDEPYSCWPSLWTIKTMLTLLKTALLEKQNQPTRHLLQQSSHPVSINTYFLFKCYAYIESKTRKVEDKSETGVEDESKVGGQETKARW